MKYLSEFQDGAAVQKLAETLRQITRHEWSIMEVCGGQTHTIIGEGIDQLLPSELTMVHGPGCPVCVTPMHIIDTAIVLARKSEVIVCSYGDMLRVPGSRDDLLSMKADGSDVRVVYSSLDALEIARNNPDKKVVFFAIGFETTTPPNAMAVKLAHDQGITNFYLLVSQVLVPPALEAIFNDPDCTVQGLLAPGHVCTVRGFAEYEPIAHQYQIPIVVTGFEPVDLVQGMVTLVKALEAHDNRVINQYDRCVTRSGNPHAQALVDEVFEVTDQSWRGMGVLPKSGLKLRHAYARYDATQLLDGDTITSTESSVCQAGAILRGLKKPFDCPAFGTMCTPDNPLGAPMVSTEGACAAYYHAGRGTNKF